MADSAAPSMPSLCKVVVTLDFTKNLMYNYKRKWGAHSMQISSRFTLAIHIFACIDVFKDDYKVTSEFLAKSTNVNPVIIRKILSQLKSAGLVAVARGSGGVSVAKPLEEITFLDIYHAVACVEHGALFHFHENPSIECPVGRNIHMILDDKLLRVQNAMEKELASITLEDIKRDTEKYVGKQ